MAYVVGLMAADGCLISGRKQLNFKSEDERLVRTFLECLGRPMRYGRRIGRTGRPHYVTQFGDVRFYDWLQQVGLMPRKSLVLGPIPVPRQFLFHCARGLLDGDGSILNYWYAGSGKATGRRYEGLATRFVSASEPRVDWIRAELFDALGVRGGKCRPSPRRPCWTLTYAIRESCILLPQIYADADAPRLDRKWKTWLDFARRHGRQAALSEVA